MTGLTLLMDNIPAMSAVCFLALFCTGILTGKKPVVAASLVPVLLFLVYSLIYHKGTSIWVSFSSRTVSATFFPVFMVCAIWFCLKKKELTPFHLAAATIFMVVMVSANIWFSSDWRHFRDTFRMVIKENTGFVGVEKTGLNAMNGYWSWTQPYLSLAWSDGCVQAIVMNDSTWRTFPYDPRKLLWLTGYLRYDPGFLKIDPAAKVCDQK
jgi:hypothetical protein